MTSNKNKHTATHRHDMQR